MEQYKAFSMNYLSYAEEMLCSLESYGSFAKSNIERQIKEYDKLTAKHNMDDFFKISKEQYSGDFSNIMLTSWLFSIYAFLLSRVVLTPKRPWSIILAFIFKFLLSRSAIISSNRLPSAVCIFLYASYFTSYLVLCSNTIPLFYFEVKSLALIKCINSVKHLLLTLYIQLKGIDPHATL